MIALMIPSRRAACCSNAAGACSSEKRCVASGASLTRPLCTSAIARGYTSGIRRENLIDRPLRRDRAAENVLIVLRDADDDEATTDTGAARGVFETV